LLYEITEEEITKAQRHKGKNGFVFPEFYGSYHGSIAKAVPEWDERRVKEVERIFWADLPDLKKWQNANADHYHRLGWVEMMTGFRLRFGRSGALSFNQLCNMPIQGAAFHRLLLTMILSDYQMKLRGLRSHIIGQIHDSIVSDVAEEEQDEVISIQTEIARSSLFEWDRAVPWDVEVKIGPNMHDWKEIEI
jgi:DNA polymerase I-like protein with 3'-5' exonuclease and polymerase domains